MLAKTLALTAVLATFVSAAPTPAEPVSHIKSRDGQFRALVQGGQCLDVKDGNVCNGALVQMWACSPDNTNQHWVVDNFDDGSSQVRLADDHDGKQYCLDIGVNPSKGSIVRLWECYPQVGLLQQDISIDSFDYLTVGGTNAGNSWSKTGGLVIEAYPTTIGAEAGQVRGAYGYWKTTTSTGHTTQQWSSNAL